MLAAGLAGVVIYLTWPARAAVFCEQLPQLTALAMCAATLVVFSFRGMALARAERSRGGAGSAADLRVPGGAAILGALAFFLAAHFIAQYRKPCVAVQQQLLDQKKAAASGQHP